VDPAPPTSASSGAASEGLASASSERLDGEGIDPAAAEPLDSEVASGFMAATLGELGKVVWPSRQQLFSESVAVILMVALSAAAIAAIDRFYGWVSSQVFR
jgi:preprotein translocase subunit SecE